MLLLRTVIFGLEVHLGVDFNFTGLGNEVEGVQGLHDVAVFLVDGPDYVHGGVSPQNVLQVVGESGVRRSQGLL